MIVPSIDIMNGQAVQLIGGKEHALDAGDPVAIAQRWSAAGELAVIDLDAAMGRGSNAHIIERIVRIARCRVGGGIRDVATARRWLNAGAERIIVGTAAKPDFLVQFPRERLIAALDARHGEVVVNGWRRPTGRRIEDGINELKSLVSGFLITFVEREGRMQGIDLDRVRTLAELCGSARLTAAGGITTAHEVRQLDHMNVDAQVGMALYTKRLSLSDALMAPLRNAIEGLWPTVVVDEHGTTLGLAWSNAESIAAAVESQQGVYWSRRRGLWQKGASSGAVQQLLRIDLDCDRDALRFTVRQHGSGFCHQKTRTCWGNDWGVLRLARRIAERATQPQRVSYTQRLMNDSKLLHAKLVEEANELIAATERSDVVHEAADLLYFTLVAMQRACVTLEDVGAELDRRERQVTRRHGEAKQQTPMSPVVHAPAGAGDVRSHVQLPETTVQAVNMRIRRTLDDATVSSASAIVNDVRTRGEQAIREHSERLGDRQPHDPLIISREACERALHGLTADARGVLERTAQRIRTFAAAQLRTLQPLNTEMHGRNGAAAGHTVLPVASAGCYVPGGRYPLPSSALMTAIPARMAGVKQVWMASPRPTQETLAAAAIAEVDGVIACGGAPAIAAMAYGISDTCRGCDVICGPGNRYVTAAKWLVSQDVRIDMLAGPSELVVVADAAANPAWIAADLIAQAEHDDDATAVLVAIDDTLTERVRIELARQLDELPTAVTASTALAHGGAIIARNLQHAAEIVNAIAPEHLQLSIRNAHEHAQMFTRYGAMFIGERTAEVFGDYGAGPNHVLPTGGTARHTAGLSVMTFLRCATWLRFDGQMDAAGGEGLLADAAALARMEGLEGHARAAEIRRQA